MNAISNLSPQQLRRAADLQEKMLVLQEELNKILGGSSPGPRSAGGARNMSAAGRAAISAAAKARWAKYRTVSPGDQKVVRHKMSAAGRARLREFARERWKKAKAQGKAKL
jgi:hypothetical protein